MKIAFLYDLPFPWHTGGIEKINWLESEALANDNEVHFFTMQWPSMRRDFIADKVHYHTRFSASTQTMYKHKRRSIRKAVQFSLNAFMLFRYKFDVVIIDQFPFLQIFPVMLYKLLTGSKIIIRVAEVWDRKYWISYAGPIVGTIGYFYSRIFIKNADQYIANSYITAEKLEKMMHVDRSKINVFSPVIDTKMIERIKSTHLPKGPVVLFAGRFIKEKRLDLWIQAVNSLCELDNSARGLLIGDGPELQTIKENVKNLNLAKKIKIMRPIKSTYKLYEIMNKSSVTLNMSEREGLSMIALESLSLCTPVVLPSYSPIPKEVKQMCIVAKPQDIPRILFRIIKNKEKPKDTRGLSAFKTSEISAFYKKLFKKMNMRQT